MPDERYPPPAGSDDAEWKREVDRRLRELEAAQTQGISWSAVDPDSSNVLAAGGTLPNDGDHGLYVADANGRVLFRVTAEDGQTFPKMRIPIVPAGLLSGAANAFRPGIASGTFANVWSGWFSSVGNTVEYDFSFVPNGGSMEWRLLCNERGVLPTVVVGPNAESGTVQRAGTFVIPTVSLLSGTDPAGRDMHFSCEIRNTGAATTVDAIPNISPVNYNV